MKSQKPKENEKMFNGNIDEEEVPLSKVELHVFISI